MRCGPARSRQARVSPVCHVARDAVAGVADLQLQLLCAGQVKLEGLGGIRGAHDAAVEAFLPINQHPEHYAALAAARLESHFSLEAGVTPVEQHGYGAVGMMTKALGIGLFPNLQWRARQPRRMCCDIPA